MHSETQGYAFNHTMLRIRDPQTSLAFYTEILGFSLLRKLDFPEWKFSLYFLGYQPEKTVLPTEDQENARFVFSREGVLELTHNWGTENNPTTPYHNGNTEPRGFGHICISVPDIAKACARFDALGISFQKRLGQGGMKNIAFIKDPDHYWIEIVQPGLI